MCGQVHDSRPIALHIGQSGGDDGISIRNVRVASLLLPCLRSGGPRPRHGPDRGQRAHSGGCRGGKAEAETVRWKEAVNIRGRDDVTL